MKRKTGDEASGSAKTQKKGSTHPPSGRLNIGGKHPSGSIGIDVSRRQPDPSPAGVADQPDEGTADSSNPFELRWPMRVKSHSQYQSEDSSSGRLTLGKAYAAISHGVDKFADVTRWPDVHRYARSMIKAVPKEDRESLPGIDSFNVDRITSMLSEVCIITVFI